MILVSNRGNINGRIESLENDPEYVTNALKQGYGVYVDVWFDRPLGDDVEQFLIGSEMPVHKVDSEFLDSDGLWLCARTQQTFDMLLMFWKHKNFFQHSEEYSVTMSGHVWTPRDMLPAPKSIVCMPNYKWDLYKSCCAGVCSDHIQKYRVREELMN